jgi:hypothetical protein
VTLKKFNPRGIRVSLDELAKADSTVDFRKKKRAMLRTQFGLSREPEHKRALQLALGGFGADAVARGSGISLALAKALVTGE